MDEIEDRFDAEVRRVCEIYRELYPTREIRLAFYEGDNPTYGNPLIFDEGFTFDYAHYQPEFRGLVVLPGATAEARVVTVTVSVPRAPTRGEREQSHETWLPHRLVKALFSLSPLRYEQLRHAYEAQRKRKALSVHRFTPLPDGRTLSKYAEALARPVPTPDRPAILIGFHWLEMGGAEKLAFDTVDWALAAGLRVFVVAAVPAIQRLTNKLPDHPDVTFLRLDRYLAHEHWPKYLEHLIKNEGIRLIHIHHCIPLYAALPHLRMMTPWVEVIDSTHIIEHADGGFPRISGVHTNLIDMHHVISRELKDFYRDRFYVLDKVRLGRLMAVEDEEVTLPEMSMTAGQTTLTATFVGRMVYQKRPIVLVKILQKLAAWAKRNGVTFHATVVGDGPFKPVVDRLVRSYGLSESVTLEPGNVDVPTLLQESDILLVPSNNEGLALVCYEAIEQGCIPISTDVGAQREIVPESLLVPWNPVDTIKGTVEIVDHLWRDADFLAKMQAALHARYRELAADPTAKSLLTNLYETVARGATITAETEHAQ